MEKDLAVGAIITRMMDLVAEHGFRKDTSRKYYCALRNFLGFATSHGFSLYSEDLLKQFKEDVQQRKLSDKYKMKLFRIAFLINGFVIAGEIDWNHHDPENHKHGITKYVSCPNFQKMIDESISYYQFHESKNKFYSLVTRKFCCELEKAGISDFSGLDHKVVDEMLLTFSPKYKGSMEKVIDNLRYFLRYLNQKNMCPLILLEPSVYKPVRRRKLIPCFTKDEVTRLLACCDRTTAAGMRDYAIVLLAVTSGLRACDIVSLELKDIDWRQYRINIIQEKTGKQVCQPLVNETGNAIATYILHARLADVASDTIFQSLSLPATPITPNCCRSMFRRLCSKAKVEHLEWRCFHSLRRAAATWLSSGGTNPFDIALFLGYSSFSCTGRYISSNPEMAKCSLSFEGIPLTSEAYK